MLEKWESVEYNSDYEISSFGKIRNVITNKILCISLKSTGYCSIGLFNKDHKRKWFMIHRLVLIAFIGKCPNGCECNHKDGNKCNNNISNLEWATKSENAIHACRTGLWKLPKGEKHSLAKLKDGEVWLIKKLIQSEAISLTYIAKMFKVCASCIDSIKSGRTWVHI